MFNYNELNQFSTKFRSDIVVSPNVHVFPKPLNQNLKIDPLGEALFSVKGCGAQCHNIAPSPLLRKYIFRRCGDVFSPTILRIV